MEMLQARGILKKISKNEFLVMFENSRRAGEVPEDGRKQILFPPVKERGQLT